MLDLLWHKKDVRIWKTKEHGAFKQKKLHKKNGQIWRETTMHLLTVSGSVVKLTKGGRDEGRGGWVVWCGVLK